MLFILFILFILFLMFISSNVQEYTVDETNLLYSIYHPEATREERNAQIDKLVIKLNRSRANIIGRLHLLKLYVPLKRENRNSKINNIETRDVTTIKKLTEKHNELAKKFCFPEHKESFFSDRTNEVIINDLVLKIDKLKHIENTLLD